MRDRKLAATACCPGACRRGSDVHGDADAAAWSARGATSRRAMSALLLATLSRPASAQDPQQEPLVVTPSLHAAQPFQEPYWVDVIDAERLRQRSYRTLPQALREVRVRSQFQPVAALQKAQSYCR